MRRFGLCEWEGGLMVGVGIGDDRESKIES